MSGQIDTYWEGEWPNLASISIALPLAFRTGVEPAVTGVMLRLLHHLAGQGVHGFFHEPKMDPSLPTSAKELMKIARCTRRELNEARVWFEVIFEERDGRLRLTDPTIIRYTKPTQRTQIAKDAKASVAAREGMRCVYCGTIQGPFHYDHIFPVSRGGQNAPSNLVVACQPCNISKNDRTLLEWVAALRNGVA